MTHGLLSVLAILFSLHSIAADPAKPIKFSFRLSGEPETLDWNLAHTSVETHLMMNMMDGLVTLDDKLNIKPMLAKETANAFDDKDWLFEIKWDGYRAISEIKNGAVELYSRNGNSFNTSYPVVYNELKKIKQEVVFDGEIVILNE